jgi:preprotein translocase subunit YajC
MTEQNYTNHRRFVKGYHFILSLLLLAGLVFSIINVIRHPANSGGHVSSALIAFLFICLMFVFWFMRQFPLKAQDRAIRAEERLRYFILTSKALDSRLTPGQIAALRFAHDDEFVILVDKAVEENLSANDIKKLIKDWKADHHRV